MNFIRNVTSPLLCALALSGLCALNAPAQKSDAAANQSEPAVIEMSPEPSNVLKMVSTTAPPSADMLDLNSGRLYMLKLINRDRASVGAPPVVLDDLANKAGQQHSDEMVINGYLGHWSLDGRKPDQRYTEIGGRDSDSENVMGDNEGAKMPLSVPQLFAKSDLESYEAAFFGEKPPDDGHRKNIIEPIHTAVGIGLSATGGDEARMSCSQEFIDHYGDYGDIPHILKRGEKFTLTGKLVKGAQLQAIDLRWEDFPKPMTIDEINKTYAYGIPDDIFVSYFPDYDQHPVNVQTVDGCEQFSVVIASDKSWKPGLYYVLVWASLNGAKDPSNISNRTFLMEPPR